ncbi:NUDIX hydrolase [Actinocorallia libanotica]|uniref:NUDIX hydrolase n=1 Tax=Actinocorallia libanotica TaxID=46162 RepID=A0ABN1R477_9ACTN
MQFPVTDPSGDMLTGFIPCSDRAPGAPAPLPASLVVLRSGPFLLLVFDNARGQWELPGGMIDPGETPHQAAVRELREETGQEVDALRLAGHARFRLGPERRLEYAAVFTGRVARPEDSFTPCAEIGACLWWDETTPPPEAAHPLDLEIARLVRTVRRRPGNSR